MKIVIVAEPFVPIPPNKYGGSERVIFHLIKGLQELGHDVILLASGDSTVDCKLIPVVDKHLSFGKTDKKQKQNIIRYEESKKKALKILERIKDDVDVIHSHGLDLSTLHHKTPCVTTLHGMFVLSHMQYFANRKSMNWVSISKNQQKPFEDLNYLGVVYNGLDPDEFEFNAKPDDYVCFIGRIDREKNPAEAIRLALAHNIKIKIAGKVDFQGSYYYRKELKPFFNDPRVEWLGEVGMKGKVELLKNAKCNLHPITFREPFGLTVLEAAYCGTPTLAVNKGSMAEIIENGRTGALVEDINEGYFALKKCFEMDRKYISERARSLFNYRNMAKDYLKIYKQAQAELENVKSGKNTIVKDKYTSPMGVFWGGAF